MSDGPLPRVSLGPAPFPQRLPAPRLWTHERPGATRGREGQTDTSCLDSGRAKHSEGEREPAFGARAHSAASAELVLGPSGCEPHPPLGDQMPGVMYVLWGRACALTCIFSFHGAAYGFRETSEGAATLARQGGPR